MLLLNRSTRKKFLLNLLFSKKDENIDTVRKKKRKNKKRDKIKSKDEIFDALLKELREYIVGQTEYTEKLCTAFERPYFYDNGKTYANMGIVFGPGGSGRYYAIKVLTALLYHKKFLKSADIYNLDFSNYDTNDLAEKLLLPDLYKALYGKAEVVVIHNFDLGCQKAIDYLVSLGEQGVIKTDKRYIWSQGNLQETSVTYSLGTLSTLSANGKYIFLLSEKSESYLTQNFPASFNSEIVDIMTTVELEKNEMREILKSFLDDMKEELIEKVGIVVEENDIEDYILEKYDWSTGARGLLEIVNKKIYGSIIDLVLQEKIKRDSQVQLWFNVNSIMVNEFAIHTWDNNFDENKICVIKRELARIVGLQSVKEFLENLETQIRYERRQKNGQVIMSRHMIFLGNPGTGKTTIARITARYLKALGCLSSGHMIEVSRGDLVGQYVGETVYKTSRILKRALGGVLFIDEAYSLARGKNDVFGVEAVDTIIKYMEDHRDDIVIILAGYTKEMCDFFKINSGLKSRFNYNIEFTDYSPEELYDISEKIAEAKGFRIDLNCKKYLIEYYTQEKVKLGINFGNGRIARNAIERAILIHAKRVMNTIEEIKENSILVAEDFELVSNPLNEEFNLEEELNRIIGMDNVKEYIRSLQSFIKVNLARKKMGLTVEETQSLHMIFLGNPGTGKTTMARIIGKMFYSMGILATDKVVETDRSGLVAGYVGQTAIKTKAVIQSATDGVLFIDEAYSLIEENNVNGYGKEAIETLIKDMEDNRNRLVVILAGYKENMEKFMLSNPGLKSRFPNSIEFQDYETNELLAIAETILQDKGYTLDCEAKKALMLIFDNEKRVPQFGNGRYVRNICEKLIRNLSVRISGFDEYTPELLSTITFNDVKKIVK